MFPTAAPDEVMWKKIEWWWSSNGKRYLVPD